MKRMMTSLTEEEKGTLEILPNHEGYYIYSDKFGAHFIINEEEVLHKGEEIEVFSNGDYAVTKDYDTWSLYRGEEKLCEGLWVLSHANKSVTFKYYNEAIGKFIIETIDPEGDKKNEIQVNEDVDHTRTDYMNFV